jgi:integrase
MRTRHQDGWVEERGGRVRKWYGHYFEYVVDEQGEENRVHRGICLGDKAKMTKWKAEEKLREAIAATQKQQPVGNALTLDWFTRERFVPMKMPKWTGSTQQTNLNILNRHVLPALGNKPLAQLTKFDCQMLVNDLAAKGFSHSIVDHCRIMIKAILEEALDADLIGKNVARKVENPETKAELKPVLAKEDARKLINALPLRDRLIVMISAFCALRPGELFALQRSSFRGDHFQIQGTAWRGTLRPGKAKTKGSLAQVVIPDMIQPLLEAWLGTLSDIPPDALVFPSTQAGRPMRPEVWLKRRIKPVAARLGIPGKLNFQVMRRTFATQAQEFGSVKSAQTHLRHSNSSTTMDVYQQPVDSAVREMVNGVAESVMGLPVTGRIQ